MYNRTKKGDNNKTSYKWSIYIYVFDGLPICAVHFKRINGKLSVNYGEHQTEPFFKTLNSVIET